MLKQPILTRRDFSAVWTESNPILASGQTGLELDTGKKKTGNGYSAWNDLSYESTGGGGSSPTILASYVASTSVDLAAPLSLSSSTWTVLVSAQSFTVGSTSDVIEISVRAGGSLGNTTAGISSRLVIDSGGTPIYKKLGGETIISTYGTPFVGGQTIKLTGLSAGTHTVEIQLYSSAANSFYCRSSSFLDNEFLEMEIWKVG